jgi:hypothetical protein
MKETESNCAKENAEICHTKTHDIIIVLSGAYLKGGETDVGENHCTCDHCGCYRGGKGDRKR